MRTTTPTARRSHPAPSGAWWTAALWIPAGFASAQFIGEPTPLPAMLAMTAALAGLHGIVPGLVELVVGSGGLLMSMFVAIDGRGCGEVLGDAGTGVVLVFGSIMWLSAFVRLLGSGSGREMARHLLVATVVLEIGLFAVSPMGQVAVATQDRFTTPVALGTVLLVGCVFGCRARTIGFPALGVALIAVQVLTLVSGSACQVQPSGSLVGTLSFVAVRLALAGRQAEARTGDGQPSPAT